MTSPLYHEEYRFNRKGFDGKADKIQFYCAFHSCWHPGFVGQASGGKYAVYSLVKSGASRVIRNNWNTITPGPGFSFSRVREAYQKAETIGREDYVRKAFMIHFNAFHEMIASHFLPVSHGHLPLTQPRRVELIFDMIYEEMGKALPDDALLTGLFVRLLQEVRNQQEANPYPDPLNTALEFIMENLEGAPLSRERIAEHCSVSVRTLSRMFRDHLGTSVTQYVIRSRLEHVCGMLAMPRISIKEIAARCGFSKPGFLTEQFRRRYGKTPKEYRLALMRHG